jgi:hypothetical protein
MVMTSFFVRSRKYNMTVLLFLVAFLEEEEEEEQD